MTIPELKDIELPLLNKSRRNSGSTRPYSSYSRISNVINLDRFQTKYAPIRSLFDFLTFLDIYPFTKYMNQTKKKLEISDVPLPYSRYNVPKSTISLDQDWQEELKTPKPSIVKALYRTYKKNIWREGLIIFLVCNAHIAETFLLGKLIGTIQDATNGVVVDIQKIYLYASIFLFSYLFKVFAESHCFYFTIETSSSMRYSLTGLLYKKLNLVSLSSLQSLNLGKVINLIANDLNEVDKATIHLWFMILAPYNIIASCLVMATEFDWITFIAVVLIIGSMYLVTYFTNLSKSLKDSKNKMTDSRIKHTHEFLEAIRLIKLYAWEQPIKKIISAIRIKEFELLQKIGANDATTRATSETSVYFIIFLMSIIYVITGGAISPEKVYTSTALLNFMRRGVLTPWQNGRSLYITFKLIAKRLEEVLLIPEVASLNENHLTDQSSSIVFRNFFAFWKKGEEEIPCLKDLTAEFSAKKLTMILGSVRSGKTTLLLSLLSELPITTGKLSFSGTIAYVEQEPIVFSMSVRDNILFGKPFEEDFYKKVILSCCLDADLDQFDHKDQTLVGERGVTLSGGQRARLSMARALYSRSDIYLLDDPLSAVDARVASHMFEHAIKDMLAEKTVVLVTHHLGFASQCDTLVVMDRGSILAQGSFKEVQEKGLDLLKLLSTSQETKSSTKANYPKKGGGAGEGEGAGKGGNVKLNDKRQEVKKEEHRFVTWETYRSYLSESSMHWLGGLVMVVFVTTHIFEVWFTRLLGEWGNMMTIAWFDAKEKGEEFSFDNTYYVIFCSILITCIVVGMYMKAMTIMRYILEINTNLHQKLLNVMARAVVSFFDETPIGRILNRFSNSLGALDKQIWESIYILSNGLLQNLIFILYICYTTPILLIPTIFVGLGFLKMRNFFAMPLRYMRQLEIAAQSPLVSEISSTINGLVIIRVYKQGSNFITNFTELVYNSSESNSFQQGLKEGLFCFFNWCFFG